MTIPTTTSSVTYQGNGSTLLWTFPFIGVSGSDLEVIYTNTSGVVTTLDPSVYTVIINPTPVGGLWGIGGSITYPIGSGATPIQVGSYLTIQRTVPYEQNISIANQGAFYPQAVEQAIDLVDLQVQQVDSILSNQVVVMPPGTPLTPLQYLEQQLSLSAAGQATTYVYQTTANLLATVPAGLINGTTYVTGGRDAVGDGGNVTISLNTADVSTADNGGTIRVDWLGRRWYVDYDGYVLSEWFGAKGNAIQVQDAVVNTSAGTTTVSSATYNFTAADAGKVIILYEAGATNANGRNSTFITTIASAAANVATLTSPATSNIASGGIVAFGTDDTTAINNALVVASTSALALVKPGYIMTNTFKIGNGTSAWAHNVVSEGHSAIYFGIPNNTANCVEMHAYSDSSGYRPMNLRGTIVLDFMGTGLDGFVTLGGYLIFRENRRLVRPWRNGEAYITGNSDYIQHVTNINTQIEYSGLNAIFAWAKATTGSSGFIDEIGYYGLDVEGYSLNPGPVGASGNELGAGVYAIAVGAGTDNYIEGWTFSGPLEINSATSVLSGGATQNPNAFFFGNGRSTHTLWGTSASTQLNSFSRWSINTPQIEDSSGGTTASGALFAAETTTLTLSGMWFNDCLLSGSWTSTTSNISFTNGNGNRFTPNNSGAVATEDYGALFRIQEVRATGQATFANGSGIGMRFDGTTGRLSAKNYATASLIPLALEGSTLALTIGAQVSVLNLGSGSPNGSVTGSPGDLYGNAAGGYNNVLWVKASGSATNTGWLPLTTYLAPCIVSALPAASGNQGLRGLVTDATAVTFHSTVAGTGSNIVPVISDGTNWLIG